MRKLAAFAAALACVVAVATGGASAKPINDVLCGPQCLGGNSGPPAFPCNAGNVGVNAYNPYPYLWTCLVIGHGAEAWIYQGIHY